jgi:hypothetical protein
MMRKSLWLIVTAIVAVAVTSTAALAAVNVKTFPTATFSGASVTLTDGNFSGLGSTPAVGELTVTGVANYQCRNNGASENVVPGQNPVDAAPGSSGPVDLGNADHNGRGTVNGVTASVAAPATPSPQAIGCGGKGSNNWTVELLSLTATAAQFTVTQDGTIVFCRNYTLGGPAIGTAC